MSQSYDELKLVHLGHKPHLSHEWHGVLFISPSQYQNLSDLTNAVQSDLLSLRHRQTQFEDETTISGADIQQQLTTLKNDQRMLMKQGMRLFTPSHF